MAQTCPRKSTSGLHGLYVANDVTNGVIWNGTTSPSYASWITSSSGTQSVFLPGASSWNACTSYHTRLSFRYTRSISAYDAWVKYFTGVLYVIDLVTK